jgi:hypothetical protein
MVLTILIETIVKELLLIHFILSSACAGDLVCEVVFLMFRILFWLLDRRFLRLVGVEVLKDVLCLGLITIS